MYKVWNSCRIVDQLRLELRMSYNINFYINMTSAFIPTLQQVCYDILAEFAGYIEDLNGINTIGIREICRKTSPFGLANIESLLTNTPEIDISYIWKQIYDEKLATDEKYLTKLNKLIQGPDYYRQAVLSSLIKHQVCSNDMDDEDLVKLLSFCNGLRALEIDKVTRLDLYSILNGFYNLIHLSLENSKVGIEASQAISEVISKNPCLQTLNLRNCILKDNGISNISESLCLSRITYINLSWNDLTLVSIERICNIISTHRFLTIVILFNNLGPKHIKQGISISNRAKSLNSRPIVISLV